MLEIYQEVQRQRGEDLLDLASVAAIPHLDARGQKQSLSRFRRLARWSWVPERSFYDSLSDEDRVVAIGSCIAASASWAKDHSRQVEWLREQGLSTQDAVRRYREWRAAKTARFKDLKAEGITTRAGKKERKVDEQHGPVRNGRGKRRGQRPKG